MPKVVRSDRKKSLGLAVNGPVFWTSTAFLVISVAMTLLFQKSAEDVFAQMQSFVAEKVGWLFILSVNLFLIFCLYLALTDFGKIRLGGKDAEPEFSTTSWFAMLFSAGMGIGLLFWSIAEPVSHFQSPPLGEAGSAEAAQTAMDVTFLHWGLHAWGIYALVGLALACFTYSRKLPLTIRSVFYPFLGERIHGPIGDVIDILAVLATIFGLATSLGLGVQPIAAGINHVFPAIALGLEIELLHVFRLPTQYFPLISEERAIRTAEAHVIGKFIILQKKDQEIANVPYHFVRAAGKSIPERIVKHLKKRKHDLLVLGLKGNDPVPSLSLGSVPTTLYNTDINVPLWLVYSEDMIR